MYVFCVISCDDCLCNDGCATHRWLLNSISQTFCLSLSHVSPESWRNDHISSADRSHDLFWSANCYTKMIHLQTFHFSLWFAISDLERLSDRCWCVICYTWRVLGQNFYFCLCHAGCVTWRGYQICRVDLSHGISSKANLHTWRTCHFDQTSVYALGLCGAIFIISFTIIKLIPIVRDLIVPAIRDKIKFLRATTVMTDHHW